MLYDKRGGSLFAWINGVGKILKTTFVGVSAHFFSPRDHRRHKVLLAVEAVSSPHTALKIKEATDKVSCCFFC
jgi:hypothetical protein